MIEQKEAPQFLPKMERCNARTMEIYRRMGIAEKVRAAGLPARCPMDVFIVLSLVEPPLLHLPYPSVEQAQARRSPRAATARCRSSPISSSRNTRSSRCSNRSRSDCRRYAFATAASFSTSNEDAASVTANVRSSAGATSQITRALSRRLRRRLEPRAQAARHRAARRGQHPAAAPGALSLRRASLSASPSARAATITSPTTARPS